MPLSKMKTERVMDAILKDAEPGRGMAKEGEDDLEHKQE